MRSLQILSDPCKLFQILLNSLRCLQTPSNSRFFQILSEFLRFSRILSHSLKFVKIVSDAFRIFPFPSDSLGQILLIFFILSDHSVCFSLLPHCFKFFRNFSDSFKDSGFLKILSNFSVIFGSFHVRTYPSRSLQIIQNSPNYSSQFI